MNVKLPTWAQFPLAAAVLLLGLAAITAGHDDGGAAQVASPLATAPLWLLAMVGIVVPVGEVLVWSVAFVESAARLIQAPVLGALVGVVFYSAVYHAAGGPLAMVASAWVGGVVNATYVLLRRNSVRRAIVYAIGLRWFFIAFAVALLRGWL